MRKKKNKIRNKNYKEAMNAHQRYIRFQEGDLVMVHPRLKRFHLGTYQKLQAKKIGLFPVLKWLGEHVYLLKLSLELHFSLIFKMEDLFVYHDHQN